MKVMYFLYCFFFTMSIQEFLSNGVSNDIGNSRSISIEDVRDNTIIRNVQVTCSVDGAFTINYSVMTIITHNTLRIPMMSMGQIILNVICQIVIICNLVWIWLH